MADGNLSLTPSQRAAIYHKDGNLLVSASAGSGKTFVMISRVIDLIISGKAEVGEILAVTYTNLAAEEMKQKLVRELVKKIAAGENAERLKAALSEVPSADFSTFHGFLGKILRSYFYASTVDPLFEIADEPAANELKTRAIDKLFDKKYKSGDEDFLYLVRIGRKRRSDEDLKNIIVSLRDFASSEASMEEFLERCAKISSEKFYLFRSKLKDVYSDKLSALVRPLYKLADDCEFSGADKYLSYTRLMIEKNLAALDALKKDGDFAALSPFKTELPKISKKDEILTVLSEEIKEIRESLNAVLAAAGEWLPEPEIKEKDFLKTARGAKIVSLLAKEFDEEYTALKRAENKADFSDLERLSLILLNSHPEIRAEISDKYKYVFADEYQDVNGVQEEILSLIAKDNLFMVGDLKQSIYAFRGCNPEIFAEKYEKYSGGDGGTALSLDENFRSADKILSAVNNVFSKVITRSFGSVDYSENAMKGSGLYKDYRGEAVLHIIEGEKRKKEKAAGLYSVLKAYRDREEDEDFYEGILTAKIIENELGKQIYDIKTGETRGVRFGDIAVLTRTSKGFTARVVKELSKYYIPVTSEAGENLLEYPEIRLLTDVLKLISFYADDAPLVSALKSVLCNLDEEELAEIRRPYPSRTVSFADCVSAYEKEGENPTIREKLKNFRLYFEKIRLLSEFCGAGEILARIMKDSGLDLEITSMPLGKLRMARVEKFISESFAGGKPLSVNEFLKRIESAPKGLSLSVKGGDDTVKVMSIHASKGLEFPVVIVAGIKRAFSSRDRTGELLSDRSLGIALKAYDEDGKTYSETLARQYFKEKRKLDEIKEEARVFYVALTRAMCRLHLVCDCEIKDEFSLHRLLSANKYADFLCKKDMAVEVHDRNALRVNGALNDRRILIGTGNDALEEKMLSSIGYEYPFLADEKIAVKGAVTKIAKDALGKTIPPVAAQNAENTLYNNDFTEKGVAYHKFMQFCDLSSSCAKEEIERLLSLSLITEKQAEYLDADALNKVLVLREIKGLKDYALYREQPFMAFFPPKELGAEGVDGKTLVQGVIDLLAVKGGEAVIIDYKTSVKSAAALKEEYAAQLRLYSSAVERTLKLKVKSRIIINLLSGETAFVK